MRAHVGMEGMPTMNFIKLSKKWSGQNRPSMTGSYAYVQALIPIDPLANLDAEPLLV